MIWHDASRRDRILVWRAWRKHLDQLSWPDCLKEIAQTWGRVPLVNHYLCPDLPNDWPGPWDLINDNIYCDLSIVLGMFYTLHLTSHLSAEDAKIEIYKTNNGWINLCSVDQGLSVLNWSWGEVVNRSTIPTLGKPNFIYTKIDLATKLD